jgi:hypothetical protein
MLKTEQASSQLRAWTRVTPTKASHAVFAKCRSGSRRTAVWHHPSHQSYLRSLRVRGPTAVSKEHLPWQPHRQMAAWGSIGREYHIRSQTPAVQQTQQNLVRTSQWKQKSELRRISPQSPAVAQGGSTAPTLCALNRRITRHQLDRQREPKSSKQLSPSRSVCLG